MEANLHAVAVRIPCGSGTLEGRLLFRPGAAPKRALLICPPHPFLAGNLDNNVVRALARRAAADGFAAVLFNYRGVGASSSPRPELPLYELWAALDRAGSYAEIDLDFDAVLAWTGGLCAEVHLAGYSFGTRFAGRAARASRPPRSWCAIAPPGKVEAGSGPGLVVLPETDDLVQVPPDVAPAGAEVVVLSGSGHFFRGQESAVAEAWAGFVGSAS